MGYCRSACPQREVRSRNLLLPLPLKNSAQVSAYMVLNSALTLFYLTSGLCFWLSLPVPTGAACCGAQPALGAARNARSPRVRLAPAAWHACTRRPGSRQNNSAESVLRRASGEVVVPRSWFPVADFWLGRAQQSLWVKPPARGQCAGSPGGCGHRHLALVGSQPTRGCRRGPGMVTRGVAPSADASTELLLSPV